MMSPQDEQEFAQAAWQVGHSAQSLADNIASYHATWFSVMKPKVYKDGNAWCAVLGEDIASGISGWGSTPAGALLAFEVAMCSPNGTHEHASLRKEG